MILDLIILSVIFLILIGYILAVVEIQSSRKRMTDYDRYGMSAEAYALTKMGDEQFIELYGQEEYYRCITELDALKKKSDEL